MDTQELPFPTTLPSNHEPVPPAGPSGRFARFVRVDGQWLMALPADLARIVSVGTAVTCDVETAEGRRYTRSGTVVRAGRRRGRHTALAEIDEYRAGMPAAARNTYLRLPDGDWGVRLHAGASRTAGVGDTLNVAVTSRSGRIAHMEVVVTHFTENGDGDRQAIARILREDRSPVTAFAESDGATTPCPVCGTTACDSGAIGHCLATPENPHTPSGASSHAAGLPVYDPPLADTEREDNDSRVEPIGRAQDETHWTRQIDRACAGDLADRVRAEAPAHAHRVPAAPRRGGNRNTFARLGDGSWGVRLAPVASAGRRIGDTDRVTVRNRTGRSSDLDIRVVGFTETRDGDLAALAEIVRPAPGAARREPSRSGSNFAERWQLPVAADLR